jgi:hypothetical protein
MFFYLPSTLVWRQSRTAWSDSLLRFSAWFSLAHELGEGWGERALLIRSSIEQRA